MAIKKGSYGSEEEAKDAADGAGAYSAIVINRDQGLMYMNVAAWGWGGIDRAVDAIENPLGSSVNILIGGKPLASNIQALVDKARQDGNY